MKLLFIMEGLSYVAVVVGVIFAGSQYYLIQAEARKEASLNFVREYQQTHIAEARLWLLNNWDAFPVPFSQIEDLSGSAGVIDQYANSFIFPEIGIVDADYLITIIDYLDVVGACVRQRICDPTIIETHLGRDARSFYCLYNAPITQLKENRVLRNFAVEIVAILPNGEDCFSK